jgi:ornithine cyclodeaminase/alanine dehydrogenase-like protein (mu-crystallin family)
MSRSSSTCGSTATSVITRRSPAIADVVAGKKGGRERVDEIIVAINMGISVEDVTTARRVYDSAVRHSRGTWLPL